MKKLLLFSLLALSALAGEATYHGKYFAYQISPIGFRLGKRLAYFWEAGYGFKGILHMGFTLAL